MTLHLTAHGASDVGLVRVNNEDAFLSSLRDQLFLIADGLGGHQAGEVAAREAIEIFFSNFLEKEALLASIQDVVDLLKSCYTKTNDQIYALSLTSDLLAGMGTTFCALKFFDNQAVFSHAGDSRIYRLHDYTLEQLTIDHSIKRDSSPFAMPEISSPKGFLTKALGTTPVLEPDVGMLPVQAGDMFLLATDGLTDRVSQGEIEAVLNRPLTIGEKVRSLIASAKQKGGEDNITMILVEVMR
jgi:PPM family protein phosphatase